MAKQRLTPRQAVTEFLFLKFYNNEIPASKFCRYYIEL